MNGDRTVVLELSSREAAHLAGLVTQFLTLLADSGPPGGARPNDPAVARLVPDAYRDDPQASADFRSVTASDLLDRRTADARRVLEGLGVDGSDAGSLPNALLVDVVVVSLDREAQGCWMRTFAALRLVLASRLGIRSEADHDPDDPRFGIYDWLGYRLDGIVRAVDDATGS